MLDSGDVAPGAFVAGVGADDGSKRELTPSLLAVARVVTDLTEQCAHIGDLHHAIQSGMLRRDSVHAELAAVVAGLAPGRTSDEEIFVFDSTGIAIQDVAAAVAVYGAADPSAEMYLDFGR